MADWFANRNSTIEVKSVVDEIPFRSRRSPVVCRNGCVASSQPLASSIGVDILKQGGNAADAAIAVAAALCVTEPCSTGLGGDMFSLYYDSQKKEVDCINGSGFSPENMNLDVLKNAFPDNHGGVDEEKFQLSALAVTVPGAAKGYEDLLQIHGSGKFSLSELLEPAAKLAEEGFPVAPVTSYHWRSGIAQIKNWIPEGESIPLTVDGTNGPQPGDIIINTDLAKVLRELGANGATKGFYEGGTGQAIVDAVQKHGGTMTMDDLKFQKSSFPKPCFAEYRDVKLWQVPPNGQGIAGLIALKGLAHLEETGKVTISPEKIGTADAYHAMIEMMRLGFADGRAHVADEAHMSVSVEQLLDSKRINDRAESLFEPEKATIAGTPIASSCTVSFQVVDKDGNAISFVNSNYMGFGTGIVPSGCGFTLQNRGFGFTLEQNHPNVVAPRKRPYHTIIPGMITYSDTNELHSTISNMGGNMQPQGHLQLTVDMVAGGLDPQAAIDLPRFCIADGTKDGMVQIEGGVEEKEILELKVRGHKLQDNVVGHARSVFGRAQIIKRNRETGVLWAGSDGRADGCAIGF
jgi:gamma-glutamyltranspeptidase/glutathione hydrolase